MKKEIYNKLRWSDRLVRDNVSDKASDDTEEDLLSNPSREEVLKTESLSSSRLLNKNVNPK